MQFPESVSRSDWQAARKAILTEEKQFTQAHDALNAKRRRLPMTKVDKSYVFQTPEGDIDFIDLFNGQPQLIVYFNMLKPGSDHVCPGCSRYCDNVGNIAFLKARRAAFAVVSRARPAQIEAVKQRMGWTFPWVSCFGTSFYEDFVTSEGHPYALAVFMRKGDAIFQTYVTSGRGIEQAAGSFGFLDILPWGRQEVWEDSPDGWPQDGTHSWVGLHDQY